MRKDVLKDAVGRQEMRDKGTEIEKEIVER